MEVSIDGSVSPWQKTIEDLELGAFILALLDREHHEALQLHGAARRQVFVDLLF